jgi:hypothetical protein
MANPRHQAFKWRFTPLSGAALIKLKILGGRVFYLIPEGVSQNAGSFSLL